MSKRVFFIRECPTCGRRLLILVEYLGKRIVCPHCGGRVDAVELTPGESPVNDSSRLFMQRVDELLETPAEAQVSSARLPHPR